MADLKNQVNDARRAGYSDEEIAQYLSERDPRISNALKSGYSAKEVISYLSPPPSTTEQAARMVGVVGKEAGPSSVATAVGTALGGPAGAVVGSMLYPMSDALVQGYNTLVPERFKAPMLPSQGMQNILQSFGVGGVEPETRTERMVGAGGSALLSAGSSVLPKLVGAKAPGALGTLMEESGRAPLAQTVSAAPIASGTQYVGEVTGSPAIALATGMAAGAATGFKPRTRGSGVDSAEMKSKIANTYKQAEDAGLQVDIGSYNNRLFNLDKELRSAGWRPENKELSNITDLVSILKSESGPRDLQQLQDLRAAIKASASPNDPNAYRIMKIVLNDFDEYLDNIPRQSLLAGDPEKGIKAWSSARQMFNQEKKADVFDTMLSNLGVEQQKFGQSGAENYLSNELRKLAKNDKQMRLFSKSEQAEIRKAAEGGSIQNMLRYIGRFAPIGALPQLGTLGLYAADPTLGLAVGSAGLGARKATEKIRIGDVEQLMDLMRTGTRPVSPFENVPATFSRGLLSTELE